MARAELRRSWPALVALGLLVGLVGAAVLTPLAGARRAASAYDRLEAASGSWDATVALFVAPDEELRAAVAKIDSVAEAYELHAAVGKVIGRADVRHYAVAAGTRPLEDFGAPIVVEGRLADPGAADEVVIWESFADGAGHRAGDVIPWHALTKDQFRTWGEAEFTPAGVRVDLRVVGVVRNAADAIGATEDAMGIVGTPALARLLGPSHFDVVLARLEPGVDGAAFASEVDAVVTAAHASAGEERRFETHVVNLLAERRRTADDAARIVAVALLTVAGIAGLAGAVVLAQATSRQLARRREEQVVQRALGMVRAERAVGLALPAALTATIGAVVAVAGTILLSPLTPIGAPRRFEPDPGVAVDLVVLLPGALTLFALVLAGTAVVGRRQARVHTGGSRTSRPSTAAARLAALGAPPEAVVGMRMAFETARRASAVPTRSSLAGILLGVIGLVGAAAVGTSLARTVDEPARYGWTADLAIEVFEDNEAAVTAALVGDPELDSVATVATAPVLIQGIQTYGHAFSVDKGTWSPTVIEGRAPTSPDEVALGPALLERLGAGIGDTVEGGGGTEPARLTVVGSFLSPQPGPGQYAASALLAAEGLDATRLSLPWTTIAATVAPGHDSGSVIERLSGEFEVSYPSVPSDIQRLSEIGSLPFVLAAFLGSLGLAALAHAVTVTGRRSRLDLAVLRGLGFVRSQARRTVGWMAAFTAVTAVAIGVPVGLLVGRVVWLWLAGAVHVPSDLAVPTRIVALVAPVALLAALALAAASARSTTRAAVGRLLRTE